MGEIGIHDDQPVEAGQPDAVQDRSGEVPGAVPPDVEAHGQAATEFEREFFAAVAGVVVRENQLPVHLRGFHRVPSAFRQGPDVVRLSIGRRYDADSH